MTTRGLDIGGGVINLEINAFLEDYWHHFSVQLKVVRLKV